MTNPHAQNLAPGRAARCLEGAVQLSGVIVGLAAFLIALLVTYEVLARSVFGSTTGWVNDVSGYLMGLITFGGAAYALAEGAHVGVDLVLERVSNRARRLMGGIADVIILVVTIALAWLSCAFWWDAWTSGEKSWGLFEVRLWIPYSFFALGMVWLLVVQVVRMMRRRTE
ncbi:MAG TPA: TRAP transporter small permease [Noviherbaspirillum sp.]|uniref:TRAP transporter small permease subunit n=1 Tax=Noviherbaspirillum sp. TaxID=1926288 RepID=UPI002B473825|nr:TRAP transporter small permease [Noviherbaspirillum sp.]HJV84975.1 TRAP transporter small permease [Noviherbaspirillum sp.]